jgi:hypothetical protein
MYIDYLPANFANPLPLVAMRPLCKSVTAKAQQDFANPSPARTGDG